MQYAIVSDLHANLQAWNAVLLDIRSLRIDRIICLGDIVGYGPQPSEVLKSVHQNVNHLVLGNHDAVICGKMDSSLFSDTAGHVIRWTREQLNPSAVRFLRSLPLSLNGGGFRCAHGDFSDPGSFNYVIDPPDALPSWQAVPDSLLFVGHSHVPGIFLLGRSGTPRLVDPQDFEMEDDKRFLVNVGSVGSPRDGDARACYCLFDAERRCLSWRRIPFDLDQYREALTQAGLPFSTSPFLDRDPRLGKPPVRELLSFSPARTRKEAVTDAVPEQELIDLRRSVRKWQLLACVVAVLAALAAAAVAALGWRYAHRGLEIQSGEMTAVSAAAAEAEANLLPAARATAAAGQSIPGWTIRLGDRRRQSAAAEAAENGTVVFVLKSGTRADELRLRSASVRIRPGMKLCAEALFRKGGDFAGTAAMVISLAQDAEGKSGAVDQFVVKEPNQPRADGWRLAKSTFEVPAGGAALEFQIRARFTGTLEVKELRLSRKDS